MSNNVASTMFAAVLLAPTLLVADDVIGGSDRWKQYANTERAGWSQAELEQARQFATSIGTAALMIVDHGNVVAAWGHVDHPFKSASIRKSVYDATIGATHQERPFDVNASVAELKIDDIQPLSNEEKKATFEQIMTARSGVYHGAAYESRSNAKRRPKRGSAKPGTQWYYNNWDYNVVCAMFKELSSESMEQAFSKRIANPLGMQDFLPNHIFECLEPRTSRHPAVTFRLSARDLARVGKLYLQEGRWNDEQIISKTWVSRSTKPHTTFESGHYRGEGNGYGRLWWVFPAKTKPDAPYENCDRVAAVGAGGQIMVLIPDREMLIVHLADTDSGRGISTRDGVKLLNMIVGANTGKMMPGAALAEMQIEKLSDSAPKPLPTDLKPVKATRCSALVGTYSMTPTTGIKLYRESGRLFAQPLGMQLLDVEVFQADDGSLRSPVAAVVFEPVDGPNGLVKSLNMTFRGRTQVGQRTD